jgi:HTH-type transcriptional regulator / antitoxin MqsA
MKCISCGMTELAYDTRDLPYTYKGEGTTIPMVKGDFCPACNESVLGAIESARVSGLMLEFNKQVNASIRVARSKIRCRVLRSKIFLTNHPV